MKNNFKRMLREQKPGIVGWLAIPSGFSAEIMAQCGWDAITVDLQHGVQDYQSMVCCFQAMQTHPVTPLVRVPVNEPGIIGKVLDAGAHGVICPMVNTRTEAEAMVSACLYPPKGKRSNGPIRAGLYGVSTDYQKVANEEVMVIPMIETIEAVNNLESILDVPGIDCVYIGPSDLGISMGKPPVLDREDPEMMKIYTHVIAECRKRNILTGIHSNSAAYSVKMIETGFNWVAIANDSSLMAMASKDVVGKFRQGL